MYMIRNRNKKTKVTYVKLGLLYLFVFSLPFEYWNPWGISSFFTISKMVGILYFVLSMGSPKINFTLKYNSFFIALLFILLGWITIMSLINAGSSTRIFDQTLLQCILLFWLVSNDFIRHPKAIRFVFLFFILGVSVMGVLLQFGIGAGVDVNVPTGEDRITFFGANSNLIGNYAVIATMLCISLLFKQSMYFGRKSMLLLFTFPGLILLIGASGSRGALVALLIGLFTFLLFYKTRTRRKLLIWIVGGCLSIFLVQHVLQSDIMEERVSQSLDNGGSILGGREEIWETAFEIFADRPLVGWGTSGYENQMLIRYHEYKDTHNMFLYLMVTGGIIGLFIMLLFLYGIWKRSYRSLKENSNNLPICLFIIYLIIAFKGGGFIHSKMPWLLLAYCSLPEHSQAIMAFLRKGLKQSQEYLEGKISTR